MTDEYRAINKKIESEKRYFMEKMSLDDCKRFQELEGLYETAAHCEEVDLYAHGFTLGTLLMLEVFRKERKPSERITMPCNSLTKAPWNIPGRFLII